MQYDNISAIKVSGDLRGIKGDQTDATSYSLTWTYLT